MEPSKTEIDPAGVPLIQRIGAPSIAEIEKLDHVAQKFGGNVKIPTFLIVNKLLTAAARSGQLKPFLEKFNSPPSKNG